MQIDNIQSQYYTELNKIEQRLKSSESFIIIDSLFKTQALLQKIKDNPILINSIYVKIATMYTDCNNSTIRSKIIEIIKNTKYLFQQLLNKKDILNKFIETLSSSDEMLKYQTLKVLGYLHEYFVNETELYHTVLNLFLFSNH